MMTFALAAVFVTRILIVDVENTSTLRPARPPRQVCTVADTTFVEQLWKKHAPHFEGKEWTNLGPEASYRQIAIIRRDKTVTLRSWHPLIERDPGLAALSYGVVSLGKRSLEEALKADDPKYVRRRNAFDAIVLQCVERQKK